MTSTIHFHKHGKVDETKVPFKRANHNITFQINNILVSQLFIFHVLGGLSLSRVVVLRKEKSPIQVELPQNS